MLASSAAVAVAAHGGGRPGAFGKSAGGPVCVSGPASAPAWCPRAGPALRPARGAYGELGAAGSFCGADLLQSPMATASASGRAAFSATAGLRNPPPAPPRGPTPAHNRAWAAPRPPRRRGRWPEAGGGGTLTLHRPGPRSSTPPPRPAGPPPPLPLPAAPWSNHDDRNDLSGESLSTRAGQDGSESSESLPTLEELLLSCRPPLSPGTPAPPAPPAPWAPAAPAAVAALAAAAPAEAAAAATATTAPRSTWSAADSIRPSLQGSARGIILAGANDTFDAAAAGAGAPGSDADASLSLTAHGCLAMLPLGSTFRVIDLAINNLAAGGINKMTVVAQQGPTPLINHTATAYPPSRFGGSHAHSYVDVFVARRTPREGDYHRNSVEALTGLLRLEPYGDQLGSDEARNLPQDYVILPGEGLFRLDVAAVLAAHRAARADVTVVAAAVDEVEALRRGGLLTARARPGSPLESAPVVGYVAYPSEADLPAFWSAAPLAAATHVLSPAATGAEAAGASAAGAAGGVARPYAAALGVYVIRREVLSRVLQHVTACAGGRCGAPFAAHGFGQDILPAALATGARVQMVPFSGYRRSIFSAKDLLLANMEMLDGGPAEGLAALLAGGAAAGKMLSTRQCLPAAIVRSGRVSNSLLAGGCRLGEGVRVDHSVLGSSTTVGDDTTLEHCLTMGADNHVMEDAGGQNGVRIGAGCHLRGVIVGADAVVGDRVRMLNAAGVQESCRSELGYTISGGQMTVLRGATIPGGLEL